MSDVNAAPSQVTACPAAVELTRAAIGGSTEAIRQHLEVCSSCKTEFDEMAELQVLARTLPVPELGGVRLRAMRGRLLQRTHIAGIRKRVAVLTATIALPAAAGGALWLQSARAPHVSSERILPEQIVAAASARPRVLPAHLPESPVSSAAPAASAPPKAGPRVTRVSHERPPPLQTTRAVPPEQPAPSRANETPATLQGREVGPGVADRFHAEPAVAAGASIRKPNVERPERSEDQREQRRERRREQREKRRERRLEQRRH
jgi:hypothetical protein